MFREELGWLNNLRGTVPTNPGAVTGTPSLDGFAPVTLIGAFGAERQDLVP